MKLPTIERFNGWSLEEKQIWLNYETGSEFCDPSVPGFIFYDTRNTVIKYKVDKKRKLLEAHAMTLSEGEKVVRTFIAALKGIKNQN